MEKNETAFPKEWPQSGWLPILCCQGFQFVIHREEAFDSILHAQLVGTKHNNERDGRGPEWLGGVFCMASPKKWLINGVFCNNDGQVFQIGFLSYPGDQAD